MLHSEDTHMYMAGRCCHHSNTNSFKEAVSPHCRTPTTCATGGTCYGPTARGVCSVLGVITGYACPLLAVNHQPYVYDSLHGSLDTHIHTLIADLMQSKKHNIEVYYADV